MPDEHDDRTTHRPQAARIRPQADAVPEAEAESDPRGTKTTLKRPSDAQAPGPADDVPPEAVALGARTTLKRDPRASTADDAAGFAARTTLKREGVPLDMAHSEARSTRVVLGQVATPAAELALGSVIKDRFEIVEELGRGGMGVVYRAKDLRKVEAQDPDPFLAIKVLVGDMADFDMGFVALQREGKHSQALNHPNLVKVFDFDRDGKLVFLTMELLKGESLQSRLRDDRAHPLSLQARLRIARGLIAGLAYAHVRKIVHADIKPSNVFLCEDDEPKILDFGIARAAERDAVFDADDIGALTVDYASVEMLAGERPQPADDVYALGCLLFRLYAGEHPYKRQPADLAQRENLRPVFPRTLTPVQTRALKRAIAFTRPERFADAGAFGRAFDAFDWRRLARNTAIATVVLGSLLWVSHDWLQSQWSALRLSASDQAQVAAVLAEARGNLDRHYWEDAAVRYVDVLRIDPYNAAARGGLAAVVSGLQETVSDADYPDAMLILRERTSCAGSDAGCPDWARKTLAAKLPAR